MDTLPFRLVPATTQLLTTAALQFTRFSPGHTRLMGRCGASDYVPHSAVLQLVRSELERDHAATAVAGRRHSDAVDGGSTMAGGLRGSTNAFRLMLQAVERFPATTAVPPPPSTKKGHSADSSGDAAEAAAALYVDNKRWCLEHLIGRTTQLIDPTGSAELTPAVALSMASVLRSDVDAGATRLLSAATGGDLSLPDRSCLSFTGSGIRLGDAAYDVATPLEHIMKAPLALRQRLLALVDVPHCVHVVARSLCAREAQGLRATDVALCSLLMLLDLTGSWSLVQDDDWQRVLSNLSLAALPPSHAGGAGAHVFTSVYEAAVAFPAMLAIMNPKAPLLLQEAMLGRIGEELFELVVHLHATNSVLVLGRELLRQASPDQRMVFCHLLDAEWQRRRAAAGNGPSSPSSPEATELGVPSSSCSVSNNNNTASFMVRRGTMPHPEGYILVRALLALHSEDDEIGWDTPRAALAEMEADALHGRLRRDATGSTWVAMVACLAVAVDVAKGGLDVRPEAAAALLKPLTTATLEGRLDTILSARTATALLLHPRLLLLGSGGDHDGLLGAIARCAEAAVGGGRGCSGFSSAQLQSLVDGGAALDALPSDAVRAALREAAHDGLQALPRRRGEELWA